MQRPLRVTYAGFPLAGGKDGLDDLHGDVNWEFVIGDFDFDSGRNRSGFQAAVILSQYANTVCRDGQLDIAI